MKIYPELNRVLKHTTPPAPEPVDHYSLIESVMSLSFMLFALGVCIMALISTIR